MGYPVAYRRSAPVRNVRGSQPVVPSQRPAANWNARTPLNPISTGLKLGADFAGLISGNLLSAAKLGIDLEGLIDPWLQDAIGPLFEGWQTKLPTPAAPSDWSSWHVNCGGSGGDYFGAASGTCGTSGFFANINHNHIFRGTFAGGHYAEGVIFMSNAHLVSGTWTGTISGVLTRTLTAPNGLPTGQVDPTDPQPAKPAKRSPLPAFDPFAEPYPEVSPNEDPMSTPINQPVPDYIPLPYELVPYRPDFNPWRAPSEQPQRGPAPAVRPAPDPFPINRAVPGEPGPTIVISRSGIASFRPPKDVRPQRQPKYVRERKVTISAGKFAMRIANLTTESRDLVQGIWQGVPKSARSKPEKGHRTLTIQAMMRDIWNNIGSEDFDLMQAILGVLENELQDFIYGSAGVAARSAVQRAGETGYYSSPHGLQTGSRYRPQANIPPDEQTHYLDQFNSLFPVLSRRTARERLGI